MTSQPKSWKSCEQTNRKTSHSNQLISAWSSRSANSVQNSCGGTCENLHMLYRDSSNIWYMDGKCQCIYIYTYVTHTYIYILIRRRIIINNNNIDIDINNNNDNNIYIYILILIIYIYIYMHHTWIPCGLMGDFRWLSFPCPWLGESNSILKVFNCICWRFVYMDLSFLQESLETSETNNLTM